MSPESTVTLVVGALVLGTVYPLLGMLWFNLAAKVNAIEENSVRKDVWRAEMRALKESNIRVEKALGIMPRDRDSRPDSDPP